jgi:hypothetical protein
MTRTDDALASGTAHHRALYSLFSMQQGDCPHAFNDFDVRSTSHRSNQRGHDGTTSQVTGHARDTRPTVRCYQRQRKAASLIAIEWNTELRHFIEARWTLASDDHGDSRLYESGPRRDRIGGMGSRAVIRTHRGGNTALRPGTGSRLAKRRWREHDAGTRREPQGQ